MRSRLLANAALAGLMVSTALTFAAPSTASTSSFAMKAPAGFDDLSGPRDLLVNVFWGGKPIQQVLVRVRDGELTFPDPESLSQAIEGIADHENFKAQLAGPHPLNAALACGLNSHPGCGSVSSDRLALILDEDRLRLDLFIPASMLAAPAALTRSYLERPPADPALVSLFGATVVGSSDEGPEFYIQNRTIASVGDIRFLTDLAGGSDARFVVDQAALITERQDWRFQGGAYWLPISDLLGRRRVLAIGASTQLDTRYDHSSAVSTPLPLFLSLPSRVDIVLNGRVLSSKSYPAGHTLLDTSGLPEGAYDVELRVHESSGRATEERRFFSKGGALAPVGRPLLSANLGFLDQSATGSMSLREPFAAASASLRVHQRVGVDAKLIGLRNKAIIEAGGFFDAGIADLRVVALVSSEGDRGAIAQATGNTGPVSLTLDLRHLKSGSSGAVLPVGRRGATFNSDGFVGFGSARSATQAVGAAAFRLNDATIRILGQYRREAHGNSGYAISGVFDLPVNLIEQRPIWLQGELTKTNDETSIRVSARFVRSAGAWFLGGNTGVRHSRSNNGRKTEAVGELQAGYSGSLTNEVDLGLDGAVGRDSTGSYTRLSSSVWAPALNLRGDVHHAFGRGLHYSATLNSGLALSSGAAALSGRSLNEAALQVSADASEDQVFDVLVDGESRGRVKGGQTTTIFVQPYRTYRVQLRAKGNNISDGGPGEKSVTVYPGVVARAEWSLPKLFVLFSQARDASGRPLADAAILGNHGESRSNAEGFFQIETSEGDTLHFTAPNVGSCEIAVQNPAPQDTLWAPKELLCLGKQSR